MEKVSFANNAIKYGLIISIISILTSLVFYIFDIEMFNTTAMIGNMVFGLFIVVMAFVIGIKAFRDKGLGGKITFGQAFLQGLTIGIIGYVIVAIYNYVFNAFIAPEWGPNQVEGFYNWMESFGLPDEALDKAVEDFKEQMTPIGMTLSSLKSGAIMSIIVSLIVAASIKKDTTQAEIS